MVANKENSVYFIVFFDEGENSSYAAENGNGVYGISAVKSKITEIIKAY